MPPTIFNVVVDTVVHHWEYLVAEREGGGSSGDDRDGVQTAGRKIRDQDGGRKLAEEGHQRLTAKAELFYADDGMVASIYPGWLLLEFDTLTGMYDRVGLWRNVINTIRMACSPCQAAGVRADEAYKRRMKGEGRSLKERQRERLLFIE